MVEKEHEALVSLRDMERAAADRRESERPPVGSDNHWLSFRDPNNCLGVTIPRIRQLVSYLRKHCNPCLPRQQVWLFFSDSPRDLLQEAWDRSYQYFRDGARGSANYVADTVEALVDMAERIFKFRADRLAARLSPIIRVRDRPGLVLSETETLRARGAEVTPLAVGKYLGDAQSVQNAFQGVIVNPDDCLGVNARFGKQVYEIVSRNGTRNTSPAVSTELHRGDILYYTFDAVSPAPGANFAEFEGVVVEGPYHVEEFKLAELMAYNDDGTPISGIPSHLCGYVIGRAEDRTDPQQQGALYFRNTFGSLAIHRIVKADGTRVLSGPRVAFEAGDRLFTRCRPADDIVAMLMDERMFYAHILKVNADRPEELRVRLTPQGQRYVDESCLRMLYVGA